MMRCRSAYVCASTLTLLLMAGSPISAQATTIDGITFPTGIVPGGNALQSGILNETLITGQGQTLMGDGQVIAIIDSFGNVVWQNGQNGAELAFVFDDYVADTITPPSPSTSGQVSFTGGALDFYVLPAGTDINNPSLTINQSLSLVRSGTLFLAETAAVETVAGDTLLETLPANSTLLSVDNASDLGYVDVSGGPAASDFNSNTFADAFDTANGGFADQSFISNFSTGAPGAFPIGGSATIKANAFPDNANAVPEPPSITVLGLSLLGLGLVSCGRRRAISLRWRGSASWPVGF